MPAIVVDSSVLIDHLRGVARATEFLERERRRGPVHVPALAAWELWKGATSARRRAGVHDLLSSVDVDPFAPAMAQLAGELHVRLRAIGRTPPSYDVLIASHALLRGLPLATRDRDYSAVPGLQVVTVD
ncbi:MAG: type II toxin-antitoxin system VapC family toxin [Euryarchaeota archaeon]|nr:type II toxin-antitoxin system VapC family toxin [Euryarchaeota archaeon]